MDLAVVRNSDGKRRLEGELEGKEGSGEEGGDGRK